VLLQLHKQQQQDLLRVKETGNEAKGPVPNPAPLEGATDIASSSAAIVPESRIRKRDLGPKKLQTCSLFRTCKHAATAHMHSHPALKAISASCPMASGRQLVLKTFGVCAALFSPVHQQGLLRTCTRQAAEISRFSCEGA